MTTHTPIRVMLVDDHVVVMEGLKTLLDSFSDIEGVATTTKSVTADGIYASAAPDVVLVDLAMPVLDGVELTERLREVDPSARIVILSASVGTDQVQRAVRAGALGYLVKSVGSAELVDAIHRASRGQPAISAEALDSMSAAPPAPAGHDLTPREVDVLAGVTQGLSNKQIARSLGVKPGTVRIHVSNSLEKLDVSTRTAAARVAHEQRLVP